MQNDNRGYIRNIDAYKQVIDPTGMFWGKISGCDIDYFYDFRDKVFVFIELKYRDAEMCMGQRMALERLCDACQCGGKQTILLLARHEAKMCDPVVLEHVPVSEYRYNGAWHTPKSPVTVRNAMDEFLLFADRQLIL